VLTAGRALKIGGAEVTRERWDEADAARLDADVDMDFAVDAHAGGPSVLPDWTRVPLPSGAPSANPPPVMPIALASAAVGA
jgi:actin-related protein 10